MEKILTSFLLFISLGALCQNKDSIYFQGKYMEHSRSMDSIINTYITEAKQASSGVADTVKSITDTGKVTFSSVYHDVKSGLEGLARGLKAPVEHVYQILVKQQMVNAIIYILIFIAGIVLSIVAWRLTRFIINSEGDFDDIGGVVAICVFVYVGAFVTCIVALNNISVIITGFVNPEYGALRDIMDFVKK